MSTELKTPKYTQDLVNDFKHQLLKRRDYCNDIIDSLDELNYSTIDLINEETNRINHILKLIQKGKI